MSKTPKGQRRPPAHDPSYKLLYSHPEMVRDLLLGFAPVPGRLRRFRPAGRYLLIDEVRLGEGGDLPADNLSAALFRLEASRSPADAITLIRALVDWLRAPEQAGLRRSFAVWLTRVFLPKRLTGVDFTSIQDLHEVSDMLAERIDTWERQWEQRGIEIGRQQGMRQGMEQGLQRERHLLLRQVRKRFGLAVAEESDPLLASVAAAEALEDLAECLLDSADETAWLRALRGAASLAGKNDPTLP